jgi:hypothetical protein
VQLQPGSRHSNIHSLQQENNGIRLQWSGTDNDYFQMSLRYVPHMQSSVGGGPSSAMQQEQHCLGIVLGRCESNRASWVVLVEIALTRLRRSLVMYAVIEE